MLKRLAAQKRNVKTPCSAKTQCKNALQRKNTHMLGGGGGGGKGGGGGGEYNMPSIYLNEITKTVCKFIKFNNSRNNSTF